MTQRHIMTERTCFNDRKNMFCRVFNVYRQNDRKTKNDRIYTINKNFNAPQIRNRVSSTMIYTTANNTTSNEQQDGRGSSVITPLPTGEGTGEGPVVAGGRGRSFLYIYRQNDRVM